LLAGYRVDYWGCAAILGGDFFTVDVVIERFHSATLTSLHIG
jgi:hypothetical protein